MESVNLLKYGSVCLNLPIEHVLSMQWKPSQCPRWCFQPCFSCCGTPAPVPNAWAASPQWVGAAEEQIPPLLLCLSVQPSLLTHLVLTQVINIFAELLSVACSSETHRPEFQGWCFPMARCRCRGSREGVPSKLEEGIWEPRSCWLSVGVDHRTVL